jgi:hypothetical protein
MADKCDVCGQITPGGTVNYNGAELGPCCYSHVSAGDSYVIVGTTLGEALEHIRETENKSDDES